MAQAQSKSQPPLKKVLADAGKKALGGGIAGALAMVVQVVALMWMRTTINFQHKYGMSTGEALAALYAQGGITRFYQGMGAALLQAPLSRFGDTAAYAGLTALLENVDMPASLKTLCASFAAALFRIFITPIDTFKTTLQVDGAAGMAILTDRIAKSGFSTLYSGALGSSVATLVGHYPWFLTYDFLNSRVPKYDGSIAKLSRSAILGFISALTSDVVSNSVRVVKTAKQVPPAARAARSTQHAAHILSRSHSLPCLPACLPCATQQTADIEMSYMGTISKIVADDGVAGLFLRGLGTKIISNGVQAMLFTIVWRYVQELIEKRQKEKEKKGK